MGYLVKLKVGCVPYTNALPLIEGMEETVGVDLQFATPSKLEADIDCGLLDAALLPVVSLFTRPQLQMFQFCGIASDVEAGSVLLFRRDPSTPIARVAYDSGSITSLQLLRVILGSDGIQPEFIPMAPNLDKMLNLADSALLIGDEALKLRNDPRKSFDLVARWKKMTGMPFVFAVWATRMDHTRRTDFNHLFNDCLTRGLSKISAISTRRAPEIGLQPLDVMGYLTQNIRYRLGIIHLDAIESFKQRCLKLPPLPGARPPDASRGSTGVTGREGTTDLAKSFRTI